MGPSRSVNEDGPVCFGADRESVGGIQESRLGIEYREGSSHRDLRRGHDGSRSRQVALQIGKRPVHSPLECGFLL